jgi:hypothetical protein
VTAATLSASIRDHAGHPAASFRAVLRNPHRGLYRPANRQIGLFFIDLDYISLDN